MQKADQVYFDKLVKKYMADEFTEAQAKYLAYKEMEFPIPDDIKKKVYDEEMTLDMTGGFLPLKIKKKIKRNPTKKYFFTEDQIAAAYERHEKNYNAMGRELIGDIPKVGYVLWDAIKHEKWSSKYPRRSSTRKYFFTEQEIADAYKRHGGNYGAMAKELIGKGGNAGGHLLQAIKGESWAYKYPRRSSTRKHFISEEEFARAYYKHDGNYAKMAFDLIGHELSDSKSSSNKLYSAVENEEWIVKYPRKGTSRKHNFSEEEFREYYRKHKGNYSAMARDIFKDDNASGSSLLESAINLPWFSPEKYPRIGTPKKYSISEEDFINAYEKYNGHYSNIEKYLLGIDHSKNVLDSILRNLSWWSKEKYPAKGNKKYYVNKEDFDLSYEKNEGNYIRMEKDLLGVDFQGNTLIGAVQNQGWWSFDKYPRRGAPRKHRVSKESFVEAYNKHNGNYTAMERELLPFERGGRGLFINVKNLPWFSLEKYPRKKREKSLTPKKKLNRGQYQNAVSMALASKIGMNVESESDKEISDDADLLLKDILDLASEGMSIDKIAEELNIEKAIVKRALEGHLPKKSNPEITYENSEELRGFINSLNDNEKKVFDFIKKRKKPYNLPKELYSTYNKLLEKYSLFLSNNVFVDGKRINIDSLDLDKNILLKEFSNPNIFYSIDESKKGKDYKKNTGMVLFLFAKELDKYSDYAIEEMVEYGLYKRTASVFMDESQNELFEKNVVSIIEYKYQSCEVPGCENMNEIYIAAMSTNPSYARNKIMVFLLIKLMKEYNTKILNFGFTYSDGEELLKYLNSKGIANVYSLKSPLVIKQNPIKSQLNVSKKSNPRLLHKHITVDIDEPATKSNPIVIEPLSKIDVIVRRTEDGKFFVIRKVPGGYTLASSKLGEDGEYIINSYSVSKFKNKKAAVEKAKEALGRKANPRKVCEQCEKREATTKFRSIMVCSKCEDILSGEEKEYRGSNIEEYEEYDDEGNIVPRKENPTKFHGTIKEIGDDIKKQIIEMYQSGDTIIRIAKVVHLNSTLVKEVLAEASIPVRKGGHKERIKPNPRRSSSSSFLSHVKDDGLSSKKIKRKSNPTEESTVNFLNEVMKDLPQKWVELRKHKFGSDKYNNLIKIIMWRQGAVLDRTANSYVTTIMVSSLYDSFDVVEKNPDYYYKLCLYVTLFDRPKANSMIKKLSKDSFGYKTTSYFDTTKGKGKQLYYDFMDTRKNNFVKSFLSISEATRILDFTNFLRDFSKRRYSEQHDVLIEELTMKILKRPPGEELHQEEIDHAKKIIKNIHLEAMAVIARSKLFLTDYVKDIAKEKGNGNGKA